MVELELSKIIIDEDKREQLIVLKEKAGGRFLPIMIGINEAVAIKMQLSGFAPPRPMTHDLLRDILETCGLALRRVVIDRLQGNTFYSKMYIADNRDSSEKIVDARPSDSIALAVRVACPIFVVEGVLDSVSSV
jgi:uncharacterized protein